MTSGRISNLIGAAGSAPALPALGLRDAGLGDAGLGDAGLGGGGLGDVAAGVGGFGFELLVAADLAAALDFGAVLGGFTMTLGKTGFGWGLLGMRAGFFAAAAFGIALGAVFFGIALPGFLAGLVGFFEGIEVSASC